MMVKDKNYKKWLGEYSNRHNKNFNGLEKYSLTWQQIREIINEEKEDVFNKLRKVMKTRFNMKDKYIQELIELLS